METSVAGSPHAGPLRARPWISAGIEVARPVAALLTAVPRAGRRLFDRIGHGLQRFDDNLWDGDEQP